MAHIQRQLLTKLWSQQTLGVLGVLIVLVVMQLVVSSDVVSNNAMPTATGLLHV